MKKIMSFSLIILLNVILISCKKTPVDDTLYKVTFVTNVLDRVYSIEVKSGDKIQDPDLTRDGYKNQGWYLEEDYKTQWLFSTHKVTSDITLYAKWEKDTEPTLSIQEIINLLLNDEFTTDGFTNTYGLLEPDNVGVNLNEWDKEKYPIITDNDFKAEAILDFELIKDELHLSNDTEAWDEVINQAKILNEKQKVKIKLPNRVIELTDNLSTTKTNNYIVSLDGFNELYVEGNDKTTLLMITPHVWHGGLTIRNSSNVYINNVSIDYKYSPSLTGVIKDYDEDNLTITMDIPVSQRETLLKYLESPDLSKKMFSFIEYNAFTNAPKEKGNILIADEGHFKSVEFIDNNENDLDQVIVTFNNSYRTSFKRPRINDFVAMGFAMYGNDGLNLNDSSNLYLENVKIHAAPGMGLTASGIHNLYINQLNIELKDEHLMTSTADGIHIANSTGEVTITNSLIENTHDDALNIKSGYYYTLSDVNPMERTITLSKKTGAIDLPKVGDIIEIYGSNDYDLRARLTVESITGTSNVMTIKVKERLSSSVDWIDAVATNVSFSPKFTFMNNIVRNKRNRGILVQVRESLIANNTFVNVGHGAISIHTSLDIFNEATLPNDTTIMNNKFINNGYIPNGSLRGDIAVFAYGNGGKVAPPETIINTKISNNFFANSANTAISFRGAGKNTYIKNNLLYNPGRLPSSSLTEGGIELENVTNVLIEGNHNHYTLESETFSGLILAGLTKEETIELKDNVNLSYSSESGNQEVVYVDKINDSDVTLDGDISDWNDIGTSIDLIGSSLATGEEIMKDKFEDYFDVLLAKIAFSDTGIYFAFDIKDDKLDFKTIHDFWTGDIVEIFLSSYLETPNADFMLIKDEGDIFHAAVSPTWSNNLHLVTSRTSSEIMSKKNDILSHVVYTDEGYSGEVYIPFTVIPEVKRMAQNGEGVAMAFVFGDNDRDDIDRKRLQYGNVPHFVEAYKTKTARMPLYIFNEKE